MESMNSGIEGRSEKQSAEEIMGLIIDGKYWAS